MNAHKRATIYVACALSWNITYLCCIIN